MNEIDAAFVRVRDVSDPLIRSLVERITMGISLHSTFFREDPLEGEFRYSSPVLNIEYKEMQGTLRTQWYSVRLPRRPSGREAAELLSGCQTLSDICAVLIGLYTFVVWLFYQDYSDDYTMELSWDEQLGNADAARLVDDVAYCYATRLERDRAIREAAQLLGG
jgi:hypothetical protein